MPLAFNKEPRIEIPRLLELARTQQHPCLLGVRGICVAPGYERDVWCCACHGNSEEFGKGRSMKAHDFFSVWGCARCHYWLDESYTASYEERMQAFREALDRQIIMWSAMAIGMSTRQHDRDAVTLALDHLIDRRYAVADPLYYALPTYAWKFQAA